MQTRLLRIFFDFELELFQQNMPSQFELNLPNLVYEIGAHAAFLGRSIQVRLAGAGWLSRVGLRCFMCVSQD